MLGRMAKLCAGMAAASTLFILAGCSEEKPAPPPPPRAVRTILVEEKPFILSAAGAGTVQARYVNNIGFLVSGRLLTRNVDVGAFVKDGDLLASLDPVDYKSRLTAAESEVTSAQATLDQAAGEESRFKQLLAGGFTPQARYDQALKELQTAQAGLVGAKANLKLAQDQLRYTDLHSPTEGVVTQTGANVGQVVQAGEMVVQLSSFADRDGVFAISVLYISAAKVGMPVKVWLQSKPNVVVKGVVREIAPSADPITGTYTVKVTLIDPPTDMFIGAVVVGEVSTQGREVVTVPTSAILQTGNNPQVWVVSADNVVKKVPVTVDRYDTDTVTISSGLAKGDRVVIAGVNSLNEGQKVSIEKADAP
ncbi:MAG: efflux RND transporter periplasmic adaptor subunit [Candidatus Kaistia colombiensis]|nr:MAG: efflux RND transporter periplasmic adaptor subunit [Kaistia sp.]